MICNTLILKFADIMALENDAVIVRKQTDRLFKQARDENKINTEFLSLKPIQLDALGFAVIRRKHILAIAPTGSGKTIIVTGAAVLLDVLRKNNSDPQADELSKLLLICPLVSLVTDISLQLDKWGIPAVALKDTTPALFTEDLLGRGISVVVASPEHIADPGWRNIFSEVWKPDFVSIDEIWLAFAWSSFRAYTKSNMLWLCPNLDKATFIFATATFNDASFKQLLDTFEIERSEIRVIFKSLDVPNLYLGFQKYKWPSSEVSIDTLDMNLKWIVDVVTHQDGPKSLIFVPNKDVMNTFHRCIITSLISQGKTLEESLAFIDKVSGDSCMDHKDKMMKAISEGGKRVIIVQTLRTNEQTKTSLDCIIH